MNCVKDFFEFVRSAPTAYHTVDSVKKALLEAGYTELFETDAWELSVGGKYFVTRNGSSIIAFRKGGDEDGFAIAASHTDFPTFRLKSNPTLDSAGCTIVPLEKYGGMINYTWFDRPLSVAGRVMVRTGEGVEARLVNVERDLVVIPSVAIHLSRNVNTNFAPTLTEDIRPILSAKEGASLGAIIAGELGVSEEDIVSSDLFVYVREEGRVFGAEGELMLSPRIDNLTSVYESLNAFLSSDDIVMTPVLAAFDNEEVGSDTKQGAASTFLSDVLERIAGGRRNLRRALATSFMISADNAHAIHPNHPELSDKGNAPKLMGGVVIKHSANQKYTTDALSEAIFKTLAADAGIVCQHYHNRSDMIGGSTLGSIATTKVSVSTVDVGIPQLAMHSAVECAAYKDALDLGRVISRLYSAKISIKGKNFVIK